MKYFQQLQFGKLV